MPCLGSKSWSGTGQAKGVRLRNGEPDAQNTPRLSKIRNVGVKSKSLMPMLGARRILAREASFASAELFLHTRLFTCRLLSATRVCGTQPSCCPSGAQCSASLTSEALACAVGRHKMACTKTKGVPSLLVKPAAGCIPMSDIHAGTRCGSFMHLHLGLRAEAHSGCSLSDWPRER